MPTAAPEAVAISPLVLAALVTAFAALVGSFLTYRSSTKANRATAENEGKKVDAEAFDRAQRIYKESIAELEAHVDRLEKRCGEIQTLLEQTQEENVELKAAMNNMQSEIRALRAALTVQELVETIDVSTNS